MSSDVPADSDPGWLLGDLVNRVPGARSAVLLSADGLVIAEHGLGRDAADQMAPLAAGCAASRGRLASGSAAGTGSVRS